MHRDDPWMVLTAPSLRFPMKLADRFGGQAEMTREKLQSHAAMKGDLLGLVDNPHAAAPDLPDQLKVT